MTPSAPANSLSAASSASVASHSGPWPCAHGAIGANLPLIHICAYLNELTDVIADAALILPFAAIAPFAQGHGPLWLAAFAMLAALSEFAGALGVTVGASRRYDGPMGKSDRAFVLGASGLWFGLAGTLPAWIAWLAPALCVLVAWTIARRARNGLREAAAKG